MRKYSTKSASNIYLRDQTHIILSEKYSPQFRKRKISNIRVTIQNPDLEKLLARAKKHQHPYLDKNTRPQTRGKANPQNTSIYKNSKNLVSQKAKEAINKKLIPKQHQLEYYSASQMRKREIQLIRTLKDKEYKSERKRKLQQIQFQYQQRKREKEIKLRRKTSETSFILENHKQTNELVKKSRHQRARSEIKLSQELYRQTERNHQFQILKNKKEKMQQSQLLAYQKSFLKNQSKNEITPNSSSRLSFSLKMSSCIEQKLSVLPKIKEKSKSKRQNRNVKKVEQQRLNVQKEVFISQPQDSKFFEVTDSTIVKSQKKIEPKENEVSKQKEEETELFILQNQVNSKKL